MSSTAFDSLSIARRLENSGFTRQQAEAQAEVIGQALDSRNEESLRGLATKGDIQEVRGEIKDIRIEMKAMEIRLLKWQLGIGLALVGIMVKGFGWLGF